MALEQALLQLLKPIVADLSVRASGFLEWRVLGRSPWTGRGCCIAQAQAVQLLGDAGVYAAAIDLRGFGTTEPSKAGTELKPIDAANGLADWANQVEATASAVVACTPGLSRLIYVGWSLGGTVLMRRLRDNA